MTKDKYNHIILLEERVKRHAIKRIENQDVIDLEQETLYYGNDRVIIYYNNTNNSSWEISAMIIHQEIVEQCIFYYNIDTKEVNMEVK